MRQTHWSWLLICVLGCSAVSGVIAFLVGRSTAPVSSVGGVAVVDLDAVASRLGLNAEMQKALKEKEALLNQKLADLQAAFRQQYQAKKQEFGETPTDDQSKQIQTLNNQLAIQLRRAQQVGRNELILFKQQLISRFREELKPTARKVAATRGLSIVVPKDRNIFLTVEPEAEITEQVIEKLRAEPPEKLAASLRQTSSPASSQTTRLPTASIRSPNEQAGRD